MTSELNICKMPINQLKVEYKLSALGLAAKVKSVISNNSWFIYDTQDKQDK